MAFGSISVDRIVDSEGSVFSPSSVSFRNRIINGDMRIDQRNAGAAVTSTGSYSVDRFVSGNSTDGAFSAQQDSSAPTGFVNSVKVTTTTADASLTGSQQLNFFQYIEGNNVADLAWGTASAKTVTLSFWVRSSLTGSFGGAIRNSAADRAYVFSYSISAANTWEYKTVTIPGDTTGTWLTTNGTGIGLFFALGAGPDRSGTAGSWASANHTSFTGAVSVVGTLNATWYITGVQLEVGSVATPFERRPYGTELMLCQRYCWVFRQVSSEFGGLITFANAYVTSAVQGGRSLPVTMRSTPTITFSGNVQVSEGNSTFNSSQTSVDGNGSSVNQLHFWIGGFSGLTANRGYFGNMQTAGNTFTASAEL